MSSKDALWKLRQDYIRDMSMESSNNLSAMPSATRKTPNSTSKIHYNKPSQSIMDLLLDFESPLIVKANVVKSVGWGTIGNQPSFGGRQLNDNELQFRNHRLPITPSRRQFFAFNDPIPSIAVSAEVSKINKWNKLPRSNQTALIRRAKTAMADRVFQRPDDLDLDFKAFIKKQQQWTDLHSLELNIIQRARETNVSLPKFLQTGDNDPWAASEPYISQSKVDFQKVFEIKSNLIKYVAPVVNVPVPQIPSLAVAVPKPSLTPLPQPIFKRDQLIQTKFLQKSKIDKYCQTEPEEVPVVSQVGVQSDFVTVCNQFSSTVSTPKKEGKSINAQLTENFVRILGTPTSISPRLDTDLNSNGTIHFNSSGLVSRVTSPAPRSLKSAMKSIKIENQTQLNTATTATLPKSPASSTLRISFGEFVAEPLSESKQLKSALKTKSLSNLKILPLRLETPELVSTSLSIMSYILPNTPESISHFKEKELSDDDSETNHSVSKTISKKPISALKKLSTQTTSLNKDTNIISDIPMRKGNSTILRTQEEISPLKSNDSYRQIFSAPSVLFASNAKRNESPFISKSIASQKIQLQNQPKNHKEHEMPIVEKPLSVKEIIISQSNSQASTPDSNWINSVKNHHSISPPIQRSILTTIGKLSNVSEGEGETPQVYEPRPKSSMKDPLRGNLKVQGRKSLVIPEELNSHSYLSLHLNKKKLVPSYSKAALNTSVQSKVYHVPKIKKGRKAIKVGDFRGVFNQNQSNSYEQMHPEIQPNESFRNEAYDDYYEEKPYNEPYINYGNDQHYDNRQYNSADPNYNNSNESNNYNYYSQRQEEYYPLQQDPRHYRGQW